MTFGDRLDRIVALGRHAMAFRRRILVVLAAGVLASGLVARLHPRAYRSETLIQYREGIRPSAVTGGESGGEPARKVGPKLREALLSGSHLAQLIRELKLYPDVARRSELDAVEAMRRNIVFAVRDGEVFDLSFTGDDPLRVQQVTARLAEELIRENDQGRAQQAAITRDFLDGEMRRSDEELARDETELARFLAAHPELARETAGGELGTAIRAEQERRHGAPLAVDPELLALERQAARIERRLGLITTHRKELAAEADPNTLSARADAERELSAARRELTDRLTQLTDQHPDVRTARLKVKAAELRLQRANDAVAASALAEPPPSDQERQIEAAASREDLDRLNAEIAAWHHRRRREAGSPTRPGPAGQPIVALETEWTRLHRAVAQARARQEELEARQFKAAMTAKSIASDGNTQMVVIDPAYLPRHAVPPGRTTIFLGGLALSIALSLAFAVALVLLDDRIRDRDDVERLGVVRLLALVPRGASAATTPPPPPRRFRKPRVGPRRTARWPELVNGPAPMLSNERSPSVWVDTQRPRAQPADPRLVVLGAPDSAAAAGFRLLRHRLRRDGDPRVIAVTSAHGGDGKSTCAANLALAIAEGGRARVLLVEADLRNPSLAPLFEVTPPACFALQLEHHRENPVDPWVVVELAPEPVHLAAVSPGGAVAHPLDGGTLQLALATLRLAGYDYIILDSPSVLDSADIHPIEECVDAVLLVARAGRSSARGLRRAAERLSSAKLFGVGLLEA